MNTGKRSLLKAILTLPFLLIPLLAAAQEDRGERIQESVTSSDDRIDFTKSKATPSRIDSVFYQDWLNKKQKVKRAIENLGQVEKNAKKHAAELGLTKFSSKDQRMLDTARANVETTKAALKEAERKANAN